MADPFTRKRLLDLAERHDVRRKSVASIQFDQAAAPDFARGAPRKTGRDMKPKPSARSGADACNGMGTDPTYKPEPGRRIYPGRCTKCDGKGRIMPKSSRCAWHAPAHRRAQSATDGHGSLQHCGRPAVMRGRASI
jgi:hypothetical protein